MYGPIKTEAEAVELAREGSKRRRPAGCYGYAPNSWANTGPGWFVGTREELNHLKAQNIRCTAEEGTLMAKPIPYDDNDDAPDERDMRKIVLYDDEALKLMQGWTGGQDDPLYAISSTGGWNYAWVFEAAIANIDRDLGRVKKLGRDKYQLGKGTFSKKEIDELGQIRDALQYALEDPESVLVDEGGIVKASRAAAGHWTVEPGRHLHFDGNPAFRISSEDNDVRYVPHVAVDHAAHLIADLFNKNGVTIDSLYEGQMGHPRRRR